GYAAIGAVLCKQHVYDAVAQGSRKFTLGHTWDGAPLPCAVGLAVLDVIRREGLIERVRERGAQLREELEQALADVSIVAEARDPGRARLRLARLARRGRRGAAHRRRGPRRRSLGLRPDHPARLRVRGVPRPHFLDSARTRAAAQGGRRGRLRPRYLLRRPAA